MKKRFKTIALPILLAIVLFVVIQHIIFKDWASTRALIGVFVLGGLCVAATYFVAKRHMLCEEDEK